MQKHFFKIFILIACFFSLHNNSYAQTDTAKASILRAQLEDTICTYVSQMDTSSIKTEEDVQNAMMKSFANGNAMSMFMQYAVESGVDFTNPNASQELGTKLGMELMVKCPALMKLALKVAANEDPNKLMEEYNKSQGNSSSQNKN
jgi:hypothetical protein